MSKVVPRINDADREKIALGIVRKQPLKKIAALLGRHLTSITNEIKKHRIFVRGSYYAGNDCRYAQGCDKRHVCGDPDCKMYCYTCPKSCHDFCPEYVIHKYESEVQMTPYEKRAVRKWVIDGHSPYENPGSIYKIL